MVERQKMVQCSEVVVEVRGLQMRYGESVVLDGVEFTIGRGEVLVLLGPNGAGKTTTIEILEGFRGRSGGSVSILGIDPASGDEVWRAKVGIVLQSWRDHAGWQVRELLHHLGGYFVPYATGERVRPYETDALLELVGLEGSARRIVRELSGGQRRRLDVAIGLVGNPVYYLKDLQSLIGTIVIALLLVGVLWFERGTNVGGVSLALLTLPGLLAMLIANEGFSNVARFLSTHREDGTLLRAKALPQGMTGYLIARVVVTLLSIFLNLAIVFGLSLFVVPGLTSVGWIGLLTFLWVVILGLLATAPWGAIMGSLVKSSGAALGLTFLPLMAMVAISGIFYPIRALPVSMQWIAQVFPVYWLGLGLRSVFSPATAELELGGTFRLLTTFVVLAVWAIVGLLLAPPVLRRMARRTSGDEMEAGKRRLMGRAG